MLSSERIMVVQSLKTAIINQFVTYERLVYRELQIPERVRGKQVNIAN